MKPATELFLYKLLWTCETFGRPSYRNLSGSFETWAYHNGYLRQLQRLEQQALIAREPDDADGRLHRLTDAGRLQALGGRDPVAHWDTPWDGQWRLAIFDVPESRSSTRVKLRRFLRDRGFGCLQNSVWVSPHPLIEERALLADSAVDVKSLILLEARPFAGETDAEIVAAAWDFGEINRRYALHADVLARRPTAPLASEHAARRFDDWLQDERDAWRLALRVDPLLPRQLQPRAYAGPDAWRRRLEVMREAGRQMRAYTALGKVRQ
jgi:phenylacetic acid degradation operon negative regulatory protein